MIMHDASGQAIGYIYQLNYALYILMKGNSPDEKISVEKIDDIAVHNEDSAKAYIQVKHHNDEKKRVTDTSNDFWRTLNVWMDAVEKSPSILDKTKFVMVTTAPMGKKTVLSYLRDDRKRSPCNACKGLLNIKTRSKDSKNIKYYNKFLSMDPEKRLRLFENIYILDQESNVLDIKEKIMDYLKYSAPKSFHDDIYERLLGWWNEKMVELLFSEKVEYVTNRELTQFIYSLVQSYWDDSLPIDEFSVEELVMNNSEEEVIKRQLELIKVNEKIIIMALRNARRAFCQRSEWVRKGVIVDNELSKYDSRLYNEWDRLFLNMKDDLDIITDKSEEDKINAGRKLFRKIEEQQIFIRERFRESFLLRGSYQMLSARMKIGWHVDFSERLIL